MRKIRGLESLEDRFGPIGSVAEKITEALGPVREGIAQERCDPGEVLGRAASTATEAFRQLGNAAEQLKLRRPDLFDGSGFLRL